MRDRYISTKASIFIAVLLVLSLIGIVVVNITSGLTLSAEQSETTNFQSILDAHQQLGDDLAARLDNLEEQKSALLDGQSIILKELQQHNNGNNGINGGCGPCDGKWPSSTVTVDYFAAGAGPAGLRVAADLSRALKSSGQAVSFAVAEARPVVGGNIRAIPVNSPPGYTPSTGYGVLRADTGAQRVNMLTLTETRRTMTYYNIVSYCTAFRNIPNTRGRRQICRTPIDQAFNFAPYYNGGFSDPNDAFAYGDFCTYSPNFTDPVYGAFRNVRTGVNITDCLGDGNCTIVCTLPSDTTTCIVTCASGRHWATPVCDSPTNSSTCIIKCARNSTCTNYDNTAGAPTNAGMCDNYRNNDPSYDAYQYLLQGNVAPAFDALISGTTSTGAYDFNFCSSSYPAPHPLTDEKPQADMSNAPISRLAQYVDLRSFYAGELALNRSGNGQYNDEYANFMMNDNVGFIGDFNQGFGAASYTNYQSREWNTASTSCYPRDGMTSVTDAMYEDAQSNGVKFYMNEPIQCVQRSKKQGIAYEVRTASKTFLVRKFLFLAVPTPVLENRTAIDGEVMRSLDTKPEFHRARAQRVSSVVMQWPPSQKAWFWNYWDMVTGNYSVRQYGDTGCFSRIELVDTPVHRCRNTIKAVYSDFKCRAMFEDLINEARQTNNNTKLVTRVLIELRNAFPEFAHEITPPILTYGEIFDAAWHWAKPQYDYITNEQHSVWAANPLSGEPLALISESVHIYYQGWMEGALRAVRQALSTRMSGVTLTALNALYAARDNLVPGDGTWNSGNFKHMPDGACYKVANFNESECKFGWCGPADVCGKTFPNEMWYPYNYSKAETNSGGYCTASNVDYVDYPVVTFTPDINSFDC